MQEQTGISNELSLEQNDVIPESSYYCFSTGPKSNDPVYNLPWGCSGGDRLVTFYKSNGDIVKSLVGDYVGRGQYLNSLLDPTAPKPQPISYKRIWWPAIRLGFGMTKGAPGYMVLFHDKNGNRFECIRISGPDEDPKNWTKVDVSQAIEEVPDYSQMSLSNYSNNYCSIL